MRMAKRKVKKTVTCELEGMLRRHVAGKFFGFLSVATFGNKKITT